MQKRIAISLTLLFVAAGTLGRVMAADDQAGETSGGSRFSNNQTDNGAPGDQGAAPGGHHGQRRGQGHGGGHSFPNERQVMAIPSLKPEQIKQLREIFKDLKDQARPLAAQMKELEEGSAAGNGPDPAQGGGAAPSAHSARAGDDQSGQSQQSSSAGDGKGGASNNTADTQEQKRQLHHQLTQMRREAWKKAQGVLSDAQLQELEQLRSAQSNSGQPSPRASESQDNGSGRERRPSAQPSGGQPSTDNQDSNQSMPAGQQ